MTTTTTPQPTNKANITAAGYASKRLQARHDADRPIINQPDPTTKPKAPSPTKKKKFVDSESLRQMVQELAPVKLPETSRDKLSGGGMWTNVDLDEVMHNLNLNCLPARFLVDLQDDAYSAIELLRGKITETLYVPLWIRHHWLLAVWNGKDTLSLADSSPGIATTADIATVSALFAYAANNHVTTKWYQVPKQPRTSIECGLHVALNAILASSRIIQTSISKPAQRTIEYEKTIGPVINKWLRNEVPLPTLIEQLLLHIAEVGIELLTQKDVLAFCDKVNTITPIEVTWVEVTNDGNVLRNWTGTLGKRRAAG